MHWSLPDIRRHAPLLWRYFKYRFRARTKYGVHSPFVYRLMTKVLSDKTAYTDYLTVERRRRQLLTDKRELTLRDYGAGSRTGSGNKRRVCHIARNTPVAPHYGQLLYRLVRDRKPEIMLELGGGLGISTLYQALGHRSGRMITVEGDSVLADYIRQGADTAGADNVEVVCGAFMDVLPKRCRDLPRLDYAFLDGHHSREGMWPLLKQCLPLMHSDSLLVMDDIHWSREMEKLWEEVKAHPKVTVTADLFQMGLVFFRKTQAPEHFTLRYGHGWF